jgi:hypothetical protein
MSAMTAASAPLVADVAVTALCSEQEMRMASFHSMRRRLGAQALLPARMERHSMPRIGERQPPSNNADNLMFTSAHVHPHKRRRDLSTLSHTAVTLSRAFTYNASLSVTPQIVSISPSTGFAGTNLTITGSGLWDGGLAALPTVRIGGADCVVYNVTSTKVLCSMGNAAAGSMNVLVTVPGKGTAYAPTAVRCTSTLEVGWFSCSCLF